MKTVALFISDLHLKTEMPATTAAFLNFLKQHAVKAEKLYLLGDIFEYWAGDDDLDSSFVQPIVKALRQTSATGVKIFWIAGNRDFLVGSAFADAAQLTLLNDPTILEYASKRYLLTHGDQLCTDDIAYQTIRAQIRQPEWQANFLAHSLEQRKEMIAGMRKKSQLHQQQMQQAEMILDVNQDAVDALFSSSHADVMIHGHTHRPALHHHAGKLRYVLSDWDRDGPPEKLRGDWLALQSDGSIERFSASQKV